MYILVPNFRNGGILPPFLFLGSTGTLASAFPPPNPKPFECNTYVPNPRTAQF
jgi:hypothetical protein